MGKSRDPRSLALVMLKGLTPDARPRLAALQQAGYVYLGDVAGKRESDIRMIPNVDDRTIDWLREMLSRAGLGFA